MFSFGDPDPFWANLNDCGDFPCTGLYNLLIEMKSTTYTGTPNAASSMTADYQVTSNNKESTSVQSVTGCTENTDWNAYLCANDDLGVLLFESQDTDRMDRSMQPIFIKDDPDSPNFNNRLNAYMDQCWDGAYTCQFREQRFPTFLDLAKNYTIDYTGSPPKKQRFSLYSNSVTAEKGTLISIPYPETGAFRIYDKDQVEVDPTEWDYDIENWAVPTGVKCGEHRYLGVSNTL
jgi:hypothetical protein